MNFKCKIKYLKSPETKLGHKLKYRMNIAYYRVMKHVGTAIKEGKEDYRDNWITIEIND